MKSPTARRPDTRRPTRSGNSRKYTRQTAHVEARRDGSPLIFGWGGHLSRNEKTRLQRRAVWSITALIGILILGIIVGFWININIVVPNQPITSVNGQNIPQSDYRKLVALRGQIEANKIKTLQNQADSLRKQVADQQSIIQTNTTTVTNLNNQIKKLPDGPSTQRTDLENQLNTAQTKLNTAQQKHDALNDQYQTLTTTTIPNEQNIYTQSQIGNDSATWLQDDVLIRTWLNMQSTTIQNQINPSASAVNAALARFGKQIPAPSNYGQFLSQSSVSDNDMHIMMALILRRDNMQNYQASLITSPTRQVDVRGITLSTLSDAKAVLKQLQGGAKFADLAKSKSVDSATKAKGGELGWLAPTQYIKDYGDSLNGGVIENWIFEPARQVNDLSPVLTDNGTYHVIQIEAIDPSRPIAASELTQLKGDTTNFTALTAWLLKQRVTAKITPVDQNKLLDPSNMPTSIPSSAPTSTATSGSDSGTDGSDLGTGLGQ